MSLFFILLIFPQIFFVQAKYFQFIVDYLSEEKVTSVTSTFCHGYESTVLLYKKFSEKAIEFDWLDFEKYSEEDVVKHLTNENHRLGVLVDLSCPRSTQLLDIANRHNLYVFGHFRIFWIIITKTYISYNVLKNITMSHVVHKTDALSYLMKPYKNTKNEKYLLKINKLINQDFLKNYKFPKNSSSKQIQPESYAQIQTILDMNILIDNKITLAVRQGENSFKLYRVWKATVGSKPEIRQINQFREKNLNEMEKPKEKMNLENGLLLAGSTVLQPEAFTQIDDLSTREADIWSKMSYGHVKLLAEDLNFSVVIRFYDDYGWQTNGTFGHLIGLFQQKKADVSTAGVLMRADRMGVVDFLVCPFRLQIGILFREPSLSSVSNIFILPFSKDTWMSIGGVIVLTVLFLKCRALAGNRLIPPDVDIANFFDVIGYIVGAVCQQGYATTPKSISARTTILVLLLNALALFTSYSACIVALLQSSSSAILSISDLTKSDLEVGIQSNFPLYKVLIKEATHPVMKEFYSKKVLSKGEKAFCRRRVGIEKMRTGMFAFEVELTAGYKLISETYEEREKCGIKEIDVIPKPFICIAVRKDSPYREMFTQRLIWQVEAGLFTRTWKLWVDQKPKCEVGRIGFISVGLSESRAPLQVFAYGVVASLCLLLLELLYWRKFWFKKKLIFIK